MKKLIFSLAMAAGVLFASSCNKQSSVNPSTQAQPTAATATQKAGGPVTYVDEKGNVISEKDIDENLDYLLVYDYDNALVQYFTSEDAAYNYARQTGRYPDLMARIDAIRKVRQYAKDNNVDFNSDDEPSQDVKDFIDATCNGVGQKAARKGTGVGILWEHYNHPNGGGSTFPVTGNPQWTLFNFRNRASAAQGVGLANMLWDRRWFAGPSVYLLMGTAQIIPLVPQYGLNFNDRAESSW